MGTNGAEKLHLEHEARETYRDELNFAEFPLALLDRPSEGQKTLEFSDTIFDHGRKAVVTRRLTISASDRYGLPTPRDEEVILGLIQLSHQTRFSDRKVFFTKGELVKLLGWSDDGKSYQRISEALNKWAGITLFWEKSWWSKDENCWVDETFHILDNVTLLDKERYSRRMSQGAGDPSAGMSSFVWNDVVFRSFKAGYIKQLDLDFYKSLDSAISKKMFRFLDKRFYKTRRLDFDLQTFAFEHIGLSRNYHNGEIKRRLRGAVKELEEKGFLEPLSDDERFQKQSRGLWRVVFIKKGGKTELSSLPNDIAQELVRRGVTPRVADELSSQFSDALILEKISLHDQLLKGSDRRLSKNPAGFLVASIREDFRTVSSATKAKEKNKVTDSASFRNRLIRSRADTRPVEAPVPDTFINFWESLTEAERDLFEIEAIKNADGFSAKQYELGKAEKGSLFKAIREKILRAHFALKGQL